MLPDEGFAIAESIGEHDRLTVLTENIRIGPGRRVDRLDEESELQRLRHGGSPRWSASPEEPTNTKPPSAHRRGLGIRAVPSASRRRPPGRRRLRRRFDAEPSRFSCGRPYHKSSEPTW